MARPETAIRKLREICMALPDTEERITWGKPHYRVNGKIFAGCGEEDERFVIGFKLEKPHATKMAKQPGYAPSKFGGKHGWMNLDATSIRGWKTVREHIHESFRLIAPKRTLAKLDES